MLKSTLKPIALLALLLVCGASVSSAVGTVALQPKANTVDVGGDVLYDVLLQTDQPFSAYLLKVAFTSPDGASVTYGDYNFDSTAWSSTSQAQTPILLPPEVDGNTVILQSCLVGTDATVAYADTVSIGTLKVKADTKGTLLAQVSGAGFYTDGLQQPEGADLGVQLADATTVTIQPTAQGILGDANGNGRLDIGDALAISQYLAQLRTSLAGEALADINKNGRIDIGDALYISQVLAELRADPNESSTGGGAVLAQTIASIRNLQISPKQVPDLTVTFVVDDTSYAVGQTVKAQLVANVGTESLGAYDFKVTYDPAVLGYSAISGGTATGFQGNPTVNTSTAGTILINSYNASGVLTEPKGEVELATITFNVVATPSASTNLSIQINDLLNNDFATIDAASVAATVKLQAAVEPTATETPTSTPVPPTPTATFTPEPPTPTSTPTESFTPTPEPVTPTPTESFTPTPEPATPTPTATESFTPTPEPATPTPTPTESFTPTPEPPTPTPTESFTPTPEPVTPTPTESFTPTPEPVTPTPTESFTPTPEPVTPTPTESFTPTPEPVTPTPTESFTPTPEPVTPTPTEIPPSPTPTEEPTPTPTTVPPTPTPTVGPSPILADSGLVLLSHEGVFLSRGTESGQEVSMGVVQGRPIDLELVNGQLTYIDTVGELFPASLRQASSGGSVLNQVVDYEPLADDSGYLVLDRYGDIHAYGTATYLGDTSYEQTVSFGSKPSKVKVPLAVDLELVTDPTNPASDIGYYILGADGSLASIGNVPVLPGVGNMMGQGAAALELIIDGGTVTGYKVLLQNGSIVTWDGTTFNTTEPVHTGAGDPLAVDFVTVSGTTYILDELGNVYGEVGISNQPAQFQNLIGQYGFVDIEAGVLSEQP